MTCTSGTAGPTAPASAGRTGAQMVCARVTALTLALGATGVLATTLASPASALGVPDPAPVSSQLHKTVAKVNGLVPKPPPIPPVPTLPSAPGPTPPTPPPAVPAPVRSLLPTAPPGGAPGAPGAPAVPGAPGVAPGAPAGPNPRAGSGLPNAGGPGGRSAPLTTGGALAGPGAAAAAVPAPAADPGLLSALGAPSLASILLNPGFSSTSAVQLPMVSPFGPLLAGALPQADGATPLLAGNPAYTAASVTPATRLGAARSLRQQLPGLVVVAAVVALGGAAGAQALRLKSRSAN
jgi:hypothetical protein